MRVALAAALFVRPRLLMLDEFLGVRFVRQLFRVRFSINQAVSVQGIVITGFCSRLQGAPISSALPLPLQTF